MKWPCTDVQWVITRPLPLLLSHVANSLVCASTEEQKITRVFVVGHIVILRAAFPAASIDQAPKAGQRVNLSEEWELRGFVSAAYPFCFEDVQPHVLMS